MTLYSPNIATCRLVSMIYTHVRGIETWLVRAWTSHKRSDDVYRVEGAMTQHVTKQRRRISSFVHPCLFFFWSSLISLSSTDFSPRPPFLA